MRSDSLYHRSLRVSAVLIATLLVFDTGLFLPNTAKLAVFVHSQMASVVNINASVEETDISRMTSELTRQKTVLDQKEREIDARARDTTNSSVVWSNYILSAILLLLLMLITLNYVLDYIRARKRQSSYAQVA